MKVAKKKVAIYRHDLLPKSETFIRAQLAALSDWSPVLVGARKLSDGLELDGFEVKIIPEPASFIGKFIERICFWFDLPIPRLVAAFRSLNVDLVHVHFGTDATDVWRSVRAAELPMIVTLHGYDVNTEPAIWESGHGGPRRRLYPCRLKRMAEEDAVRFVAVSKYIAKRAISLGVPSGKISLAYIGVDVNMFRPSKTPICQRPMRILFVGRLVENKGPLLLINAVSELRKELCEVELVMVGVGAQMLEAKRVSKMMNINVRFAGACDQWQVVEELKQARVLAAPSIKIETGASEGFGLSALEAQSAGVPVVVSSTGGLPEALIPGETGLIFEEGNLQALVEALKHILCDGARNALMGVKAREFAIGSFNLSESIGGLECIYDSVYSDSIGKGYV